MTFKHPALRISARVLVPLLIVTASLALTVCNNPTFIEFARYVAPAAVTPAGYDANVQWNMEMVNAPAAWGILEDRALAGHPVQTILVAVLDTGVHAAHPALFDQVNQGLGRNVTLEPAPSPNDDPNGHGTHVAGIVASKPSSADGSPYGVSFPRVEIVSVKVFRGDSKLTTTGEVTLGVDYAVGIVDDHPLSPVKVINLSLGGPGSDPALFAAIQRAVDSGITVVAASGNANQESVVFPAAFSNAIGVGAVDNLSRRWVESPFGSSYGFGLAFMAPGSNIRSTLNTNLYGPNTGTSMATPHVAGVAALLYAVEPGLNQEAVYAILRATARDLGAPGWDKYYGHGLVDARAALEYLINLQGRIPRAPMGAYAVGGSGGLRLEPQTLSGAQLPEAGAEYDSQSVILRFHDGQGPSGTDGMEQLELQLIERYGVASVRRIGDETVVVGLGPGQEPVTVMQSLADLPEVQYSQPNFIYRSIR